MYVALPPHSSRRMTIAFATATGSIVIWFPISQSGNLQHTANLFAISFLTILTICVSTSFIALNPNVAESLLTHTAAWCVGVSSIKAARRRLDLMGSHNLRSAGLQCLGPARGVSQAQQLPAGKLTFEDLRKLTMTEKTEWGLVLQSSIGVCGTAAQLIQTRVHKAMACPSYGVAISRRFSPDTSGGTYRILSAWQPSSCSHASRPWSMSALHFCPTAIRRGLGMPSRPAAAASDAGFPMSASNTVALSLHRHPSAVHAYRLLEAKRTRGHAAKHDASRHECMGWQPCVASPVPAGASCPHSAHPVPSHECCQSDQTVINGNCQVVTTAVLLFTIAQAEAGLVHLYIVHKCIWRRTCHPADELKLVGAEAQSLEEGPIHVVLPGASVMAACRNAQPAACI